MIFIWGTGGDCVRLSPPQPGSCPYCQRAASHSYWLNYRYFHFFFLFGNVVKREYRVVCDSCQQGKTIPLEQVPPEFRQAPIPFHQRFGLVTGAVVGVGSFALLIGVLIVVSIFQHDQRMAANADHQKRMIDEEREAGSGDKAQVPPSGSSKSLASKPSDTKTNTPPKSSDTGSDSKTTSPTVKRDLKKSATLATADDVRQALAALKSGDRAAARQAAEQFAASKPIGPTTEVADALLAELRAGNHVAQLACAKALAVWNGPDTVPGLLEILPKEKDNLVSREIFKTLAAIHDERAIKPLVKMIDNLQHRRDATDALQAFGDAGEQALIADCVPGETEHLKAVCEALGRIGTKSCIPALDNLARQQDLVLRGAAKNALQSVRARNS